MSEAPTEPGGFVGDIYYDDRDSKTFGTYRWNGSEWVAFASEQEAMMMLIGSARARIADRERQLTEARKVKPLEWLEVELPSRGGGKYKADGYTIRKIEGLWLLDFAGEGKSAWRWIDLEEAKAAAQADYATRILSALKEQQP